LLATASAGSAQTALFWNAPNGGTGTWNTTNTNWSTTAAGSALVVWNSADQANFGNTAGTVTLGSAITSAGLVFTTTGYIINGGGNTLTLAGTNGQIINTNAVNATINATIGGALGLSKSGTGTLTLGGANTYTGTTTVNAGTLTLSGANTNAGTITVNAGGTLIGIAQAAGSPFGASTNPITLAAGTSTLDLVGIGSSTTTTSTGAFTFAGASNLIIDNTSGSGGGATTTLAAGTATRSGSGTLVVAPATGSLGTGENVTLTGGNTTTNGILPTYMVAQASSSNTAGDFLGYSGGLVVATYTSSDITTSTNTSVVNQTTAPAISGSVAAYALKTNQAINLNGNTLTLGNGSTGTAGLILNGGSISNGTLSFGGVEGTVYVSGTGSIGANVANVPLTVFGPGSLSVTGNVTVGSTAATIQNNLRGGTLTFGTVGSGATVSMGAQTTFSPATTATTVINSVLVDATPGSGSVSYAGSTSGVTQINSLNTYSGPTTLNGLSTIQFSTDSQVNGSGAITAGPFGTGTLVLNNTANNLLQPIGGNRTIANPMTLNFGFTVGNAASDTSSLTFTGPLSEVANGRTLTNNLTAGATLTLGLAATPSTISLSTASSQNMTIGGTGAYVINDSIQDNATPPATANTISYTGTGSAVFNGQLKFSGAFTISGTGSVALNAQNTYPGGTTLSGAGPPILLGVSSTPTTSAPTSGPFGTGTITFSSGTPAILEPVGADRFVSNAVTFTNGFFAGNVVGDPHNLYLTGNLTLGATSRTSTNNMVAGQTLFLGNSPNSATFALGSTMTFQTQTSGSGNTVINDTISGVGGLQAQNNVILNLNGNNSYGGTTKALSGSKIFFNGANIGTGAITATGTGAVGSGGTVGGTGSVAGPVTISSTTGASQGGIVTPGPGGNSAGTLTVNSMTWDPFGRYVFAYNGADNTTGSGVNNFINGIAGTLDLSNLGTVGGSQSATPFDLNTLALSFATAPGTETYTLATFAGGITGNNGTAGQPIPAGTDVSNLFSFSGQFSTTPDAKVVGTTGGPESLQLTFTPVPEPGTLLLVGGAAGLGWWRIRRRAGKGRQLPE
jgi:autotransporter-associated beta strand protein